MHKEKAQIMDSVMMCRAIARISYEILERNKGIDDLCIVGILSRGVELAQRIAAKIQEVEGKMVPVGYLDITPYRDDIDGEQEIDDKTDIPFSVVEKKVVLVDDVIYTGRSVRAAIDALVDRGRPRSIQMAALIDRGHRELPIRADYIGKNLPTSKSESIQVMVMERDGIDRVAIVENDETERGENV